MGENWHLFWQNQIPSEQAAWGGLGPRGQGKGAGNRKTSPRVHWVKQARPAGGPSRLQCGGRAGAEGAEAAAVVVWKK